MQFMGNVIMKNRPENYKLDEVVLGTVAYLSAVNPGPDVHIYPGARARWEDVARALGAAARRRRRARARRSRGRAEAARAAAPRACRPAGVPLTRSLNARRDTHTHSQTPTSAQASTTKTPTASGSGSS